MYFPGEVEAEYYQKLNTESSDAADFGPNSSSEDSKALMQRFLQTDVRSDRDLSKSDETLDQLSAMIKEANHGKGSGSGQSGRDLDDFLASLNGSEDVRPLLQRDERVVRNSRPSPPRKKGNKQNSSETSITANEVLYNFEVALMNEVASLDNEYFIQRKPGKLLKSELAHFSPQEIKKLVAWHFQYVHDLSNDKSIPPEVFRHVNDFILGTKGVVRQLFDNDEKKFGNVVADLLAEDRFEAAPRGAMAREVADREVVLAKELSLSHGQDIAHMEREMTVAHYDQHLDEKTFAQRDLKSAKKLGWTDRIFWSLNLENNRWGLQNQSANDDNAFRFIPLNYHSPAFTKNMSAVKSDHKPVVLLIEGKDLEAERQGVEDNWKIAIVSWNLGGAGKLMSAAAVRDLFEHAQKKWQAEHCQLL